MAAPTTVKTRLTRFFDGDRDDPVPDHDNSPSGEEVPDGGPAFADVNSESVGGPSPVDQPVSESHLTPWKEALKIGKGVTIFAGQTLSGKTNCMRNLIRADCARKDKRKWNDIYVISPNAEDEDYLFLPNSKKLMPTKARIAKILSRYEGDDLKLKTKMDPYVLMMDEVMESQLRRRNKGKKFKRTLLILDDLVGTLDMSNSKTIDKLAAMGRKRNVTTFIATQNLNKISTTVKNNASSIIVTRIKQHEIRTLYELSAASFGSETEFKRWLESTMVDYQLCAFNMTPGYSRDTIKVCKPPICKPFKVRWA